MLKSYLVDESGAVTVDWVVLTAAIVGLSVAILSIVREGAYDAASDIQLSLERASGGSF